MGQAAERFGEAVLLGAEDQIITRLYCRRDPEHLRQDRGQELERKSWWQQESQAWLAHFPGQLGNLLGISKTVFSGDSAPSDVKRCYRARSSVSQP